MLSIHAIGHRAIEQAVRRIEIAGSEGIVCPTVRIEHAQFISPRQARRCREAGIVLSMQPNFNSDSRDYADRLIPRHRAENNPFRMLIDEVGFAPGKDLLLGSDGMPHGPEEALRCCLFPDFEGQALAPEELAAGYGRARAFGGEGCAFGIDADARTLRRIS
jgi:predicted amidohydrolase YtcJ